MICSAHAIHYCLLRPRAILGGTYYSLVAEFYGICFTSVTDSTFVSSSVRHNNVTDCWQITVRFITGYPSSYSDDISSLLHE